MKIRCPHCHQIIDYTPQGTELKKKRCGECRRCFKVKEQDRINDIRHPILRDRNRMLMKQITQWMLSGNAITNIKSISEVFHLLYLKAWRIVGRMAEYEIIRKNTDGKYALYHPYIADMIDNQDELPVYCEWHSIKVRCELIHKVPQDRLKARLRSLGIRFTSRIMCGGWEKLWVYPNLQNWDCIEINKNTIYLNFNGIIRTYNPIASINDIENFDLVSAITFLSNIGVTIDDQISDVHGHWAFLGQKLTPDEHRMYENVWTDESTGVSEIETDDPQVAQEIINAIGIIMKIDRFLKFRFMNKERHLFFRLKQMFKNKQLSMMQYIESVQSLETYQMFGVIHNFRARHRPMVVHARIDQTRSE